MGYYLKVSKNIDISEIDFDYGIECWNCGESVEIDESVDVDVYIEEEDVLNFVENYVDDHDVHISEFLLKLADKMPAYSLGLLKEDTFAINNLEDDFKAEHLLKVYEKYSLEEIETKLPI